MQKSNLRVAVTGFYGTGSSAVIDLLSEYSGAYVTVDRRYEHVLLTCAGGLADLYGRLFAPQSDYMIRDSALGDFRIEMYKQYNCDFRWYGSYKRLYGEEFKKAVDEFLSSISITGDKKALAHCKGVRFSLIKAIMQLGAKIFTGRKIVKYGNYYIYDGEPVRYLTADEGEFVAAARKFTAAYLDLCDTRQGKIAVFDHLLFPEQKDCVNRFFGEDFKLIIVDRDPRDVYFSDKYVWSKKSSAGERGPFPEGTEGFCRYWRQLHDRVKAQDEDKVLHVRFEDLIYRYDETVHRIQAFCGLTEGEHIRKKQILNPDISVKNTQVFKLSGEFEQELKIIEKLLPDMFYDFPRSAGNYLNEVKDI